MIVDFRLRPPFGGFLSVGMYADKNAADFYAKNIGMSRSESARRESMELLLVEMDENGITLGVVTGRLGHRKGNVPNEDIVRLVSLYPERFVGLAGLDASDIKGAITEIHKHCLDGPLKGVVLEPGAMPEPCYADDSRLYPLYAECETHGLPVMLMIGGRAGPDRTYSDPMIISRIAHDFPGINFIVAHACWPFVQEILGICFYQENIYLCTDLYFFNLPGQDDYIRAANFYMHDRFLYASAYPFTPLKAVKEFKSYFKPKVLDNLLYQNALRVLKINPQ
ncbi:amidohydrolase family protein [uncultured Bilophila sp.]|uniref:amidohydrolase family protein n=1 Tax=uncultured Bilophila sp. TaxID=529385 RepID=UPI00280ADF4C|nr:amidohydrolase family protein [uncultured Bilophila sp.]